METTRKTDQIGGTENILFYWSQNT